MSTYTLRVWGCRLMNLCAALAILAVMYFACQMVWGCAPKGGGFFGLGGGSGGKPSTGTGTFRAGTDMAYGTDGLAAGVRSADQRAVDGGGAVAVEGAEGAGVPDRVGGDSDAAEVDRRLGGMVHPPGRAGERDMAGASGVGMVEKADLRTQRAGFDWRTLSIGGGLGILGLSIAIGLTLRAKWSRGGKQGSVKFGAKIKQEHKA